MDSQGIVLSIKDLMVTYEGQATYMAHPALLINELSVAKGSFTLVVGNNGSGKSSLLRAILGKVPIRAGSIVLNGDAIHTWSAEKRSRRVASVFQQPLQGVATGLTVYENFRLAALRQSGAGLQWGLTRAFKEKVAERLTVLNMGLERQGDKLMGQFSGGQQQAMALLMATWTPVELLLLDEPTAALDQKSAEVVMELCSSIAKVQQITTLLVTHDLEHPSRWGDRCLQMKNGALYRDWNLQQQRPDRSMLLEGFL